MAENVREDYSKYKCAELRRILRDEYGISHVDVSIPKAKLLEIIYDCQKKREECVAPQISPGESLPEVSNKQAQILTTVPIVPGTIAQKPRKKKTKSEKCEPEAQIEKDQEEEHELYVNTSGFQLKPISQEQQNAVNHFASGENVVLNAVAGSGKTTFVLHLAQRLPERRFLLLTYNKRLSDETKEKCETLNIKNMMVYTFHACATFLYHCTIYTDTLLKKHLQESTFQNAIDIDALIIDEAQDMRIEFYQLTRTIMASLPKIPQLCVIGDTYQTIYEFREADKRFIELAPDIYDMPFTQCELSTSYRCTIETAQFVNALIGRERIKSDRHGPKPTLITINDIFDTRSINAIVKLIRDKSNVYGKNGTFVLAPSVKSKTKLKNARSSPISIIMNTLSKSGTDVFVQQNDEQELSKKDIDSMQNKISAITYHKSKGLERDCAIVFAFDNTYFKYYNKSCDSTRITNAQYVAITRAKTELILIQQAGHVLPFLRNALHYCDKLLISGENVIVDTDETRENYRPLQREKDKPISRSPTELLSFVPGDIINECITLLKPQEIKPERKPIELSLSTQSRNGNIEEVSEITGTMITLAHAENNHCMNGITRPDNLLRQFKWEWNFDNPENACKGAACLNAMQSGYTHKLYQIEKWDWLSPQIFAQLSQRLSDTIGKVGIAENFCTKSGKYPLHGFVDWTTKDTLYEIKCVSALTDIHVLQLALYAYMTYDNYIRFILYNVRTQQTIEIPRQPIEVFERVVELLWRDRDVKQKSDAEFVGQMRAFIPKS